MNGVLGEHATHIIKSKLDPDDTARIACVNKKFKAWADDDSLWALHCYRELSLSSPFDPNGNLAPSFMVAYQLWRKAFSMYPWPLVKRVKKCWDKIKTWLGSNYPEVAVSLRRGATEEELNSVEKILNVKLPISTKLLYRLHNGQYASKKSLGLIGGYTVYDHLVNVYLLPLSEIVKLTKDLPCYLGSSRNCINVVIAASLLGNDKFFSLNCATMQLSVGTRNFREHGEMIPCVPNSVLMSNDVHKCDGLLLWLEEHGRRLETGMVSIRGEHDMKSICQFPENLPLCTTAVRNDMQVRASAVLAPELSDIKDSEFLFIYSIRMSLLIQYERYTSFDSCKLCSTHLIIRDNETIKLHDVGEYEALIGMVLNRWDKEFRYLCCTNQRSTRGSIEGSFTFVPISRRLGERKEDAFEVEVARLDLDMPKYIF